MRNFSNNRGSESINIADSGRLGRNTASVSSSTEIPTESDRLLPPPGISPTTPSYVGISSEHTQTHQQGSIRERRSSKSPNASQQYHLHRQSEKDLGRPPVAMSRGKSQASRGSRQSEVSIPQLPAEGSHRGTLDSTDSSAQYEIYNDNDNASRSGRSYRSGRSGESRSRRSTQTRHLNYDDYRQEYYNERAIRIFSPEPGQPSLLEVPDEIYAVRRAALRVLDPLTYTWLVVAMGFATTAALAMAKWTGLLPSIAYWFILLPSWLCHGGLLACHIMSARALSTFIAEANDNRQRQDSTDHLDRTEYLPLLQRSLKFGLKTGILSVCVFVFEILIYFLFSKGSPTLAVALTPIWIIVAGGILDGIICKTQHIIRLFCWLLVCAFMVLLVLRVDHQMEELRWRTIASPILVLLSISSSTLIYIVYGHQIGYFRLSESQLTAAILYSMGSLMGIGLLVVIVELHLVRPVDVETRVFMVALAPLVVSLVGLGAWAISRDEFERLLQYGGQATVHPMKLRLEPNGWTSVESQGVTSIPMFGEVRYAPLDADKKSHIELCSCCACYPYEDEDEIPFQFQEKSDFQYLASRSSLGSVRQLPRGVI